EARGERQRRARRLGLWRLRGGRRRPRGAGGVARRNAPPPDVRHHGRHGARGRPAVRRRDRRLRRAARVTVFDELRGVVETGGRAVVLTIVAGDGLGAKLLVREDGSTIGDGPGELAALAPEALRRGRSHVIEHDGATVFADVFGPPPRLLVYGAIDTAEALW